MKRLFFILRTRGANWDREQPLEGQADWAAHADFMNGLAKDVPMSETYKGVVPFLVSDALRMTLLILFPGITLWLVRMLG